MAIKSYLIQNHLVVALSEFVDSYNFKRMNSKIINNAILHFYDNDEKPINTYINLSGGDVPYSEFKIKLTISLDDDAVKALNRFIKGTPCRPSEAVELCLYNFLILDNEDKLEILAK